jgi:hypothetical protein
MSNEIKSDVYTVEGYLSGGIIYFINDTISGCMNIGRTNYDVELCLYQLQLGNVNELIIYKIIGNCNSRFLEKQLHKYFKSYHVRGNWYMLSNKQIDDMYFYIISQ